MTLVRVEAPHFVAGLEIEDGACVRAAPILGYCVGRSATWCSDYFKRKGWRASIILPRPVAPSPAGLT